MIVVVGLFDAKSYKRTKKGSQRFRIRTFAHIAMYEYGIGTKKSIIVGLAYAQRRL
jgi:hypothetical protein